MASEIESKTAPEPARYQPGKLTLTSEAGPLTLEQREFYEKNGYVVVRNLFPKGTFDDVHRHYLDICAHPEEHVGKRIINLVRDIRVVKGECDRSGLPNEYSVIKLNGFGGVEGEDAHFARYMRHPMLMPYIRQFLKSDDLATRSHMYVCKPPGLSESNRHPMHQDLVYFPVAERAADGTMTQNSKDSVVCAWTAIGPVVRRNGCLVMVPGSHWKGLRKHAYPSWSDNNMAYFGIQDLTEEEIEQRQHVEMNDGDVVFFHPETIHGSGFNKVPLEERDSDIAFRKGIAVHYIRKSTRTINWKELPQGTSSLHLRPKDMKSTLGRFGHVAKNMARMDVNINEVLNQDQTTSTTSKL